MATDNPNPVRIRRHWSLAERIAHRSGIPNERGCIPWLGYLDQDGYGTFKQRGKMLKAHRIAWQIAHDCLVPEGLSILHECDTPSCINAAHLRAGTTADNMADRERRGRGRRIKGEQHANAKLTAAQVDLIRKDLRYQHVIAAEYGISQSNVSLIKAGKNWATQNGVVFRERKRQ